MMMDEHVVEYVSGLPAVKSVTNDRIRYTDEFKRRVAEGYRRGESPVATMGVVLAQEERINALERRLGHVAAVLQGMGVDA